MTDSPDRPDLAAAQAAHSGPERAGADRPGGEPRGRDFVRSAFGVQPGARP